jgi:FixJ family two-component response regulator
LEHAVNMSLRPHRVLVIIVEDDESVRESLPDLLNELGYDAQAFASAEEFLACAAISNAGCMLLDIGLPGMSGPDLQRQLIRQGYRIPTIFITARADRSLPPDLFKEGAVACLIKPFSEQELREALDLALPG